ncbi:MAG: hypothetical protein H7Y41_01140 [Hyphomonadaceae bacterium]|nr:hypothetical protein [Clostridia bacterium]
MRKFVVRCLLLCFVCSFVFTPTLVQAVAKTSTWVFYPQSVRGNVYGNYTYGDNLFKAQNKVFAVDNTNHLKATANGERWEEIGEIDSSYERVLTNGKQIIAQNWRNKAIVSDDGKSWEPCGVQDSLYRINSEDIFVTYPSWEFQYSNDGRDWHTVNLHDTALETDENFWFKNKGKKDYSEFKTVLKLQDKYYMFTDEGASIVSADMQNWSINTPKLDWINERGRFTIETNGTCIIYQSDNQIRISMDGTNWTKTTASIDVQWDGNQFVDVINNQKTSQIRTSKDGLVWKTLKEIEDGYDYYGCNIIVSEFQSIVELRSGSQRLLHDYLVKDGMCLDLGEKPWAYSESASYKLGDKNMIIYRDFSTLVQYNTANVKINNKELNTIQSPIIDNGRTLVPLRTIFEELGLTVAWDGKTQTVTGTKAGQTITLQIGNPKATVNGKEVTLDVSAKIVNSTTLVPARFIAESLGCDVQWDSASNTVNITSN